MAEEFTKNNPTSVESGEEGMAATSTDRGLFDFMKKKDDEKKEEEQIMASEFENKVQVSEVKEVDEEKKHHGSLLDKLRRSDSSSSSSSSDEEGDEEKKKKKKEKKGLKDKIKDKLKGGETHKEEDTNVPIEKYEEEDKKEEGFLDKIKEKLPGGHKKSTFEEEHVAAAPAPAVHVAAAPAPAVHVAAAPAPAVHVAAAPAPAVHVAEPHTVEGEPKEKKGFLEKIKDKIPGFHSKDSEHEEKKDEVKREIE